MKHLISLFYLSTLLFGNLTAGTKDLTPDAPRIIKGTDSFEFSYKMTIPRIEEDGRLWLPIASSDRFQKVELLGVTTHKPWSLVKDPDYENQIFTMDLATQDSGKSVQVRYRVVRSENPGHAAPMSEDPCKYLREESLVPKSERLKKIALAQTRKDSTDSEKGAALYSHTLERMAYDKTGTGWGRGDAIYACDSRTGNCTDFHAYFIGLARSLNIPARFAIGFTIPADSDEGEISGYHCWAEYYADGRWNPVDISEADKHPEMAEYYAGHHPANRFQLTMGRDLKTEPAPASGPINFLVYPLIETAGKVVPAEREFRFRRIRDTDK